MIVQDAYAAGFFDGEGCVAVVVRSRSEKEISLVVTIGQLDNTPLDFLAKNYGGKVNRHAKKYKDEIVYVYSWCLYGENALSFMRTVRPYLICKAEEVDAALKFPISSWKKNHFCEPLPEGVRDQRVLVMDELRDIRKRKKDESRTKVMQ